MTKIISKNNKTCIVRSDELFKQHGFGKITKTVTLQQLVNMKTDYVSKLTSLLATLNGLEGNDVKLDELEKLVVKIKICHYNLSIIKEQIAICNVGLPQEGLPGLNGIIFHSGDLKVFDTAILKLSNRLMTNPNKNKIAEFCFSEHNEAALTRKAYRDIQKQYNKKMKIEIELIM